MDKLIRKVLYTGIGIFSATTERLQKAVDDLVARGKISEEEGKKVVDDVVKNTEYKKDEYESRFRRLIDTALNKLNLPQNGSDNSYDKLEKRVKSLEVKLGLLAKELEAKAGKTTAKKTVATKAKKETTVEADAAEADKE